MGQAMATMFWGLLGREAGKSCDHNDDEDGSDSAENPSSDSSSCYLSYDYNALRHSADDDDEYSTPNTPRCIDIDEQNFETVIQEVAIRVADNIRKQIFDAVIPEVPIRVADKIGKLPLPAEEQAISSRRWGKLGPYSWEQKILLVGEGDFSFSASLAVAFGDASNMIATSLDSFEFLMQNYARAVNNILELTSKSCKVMHRVNAKKMANHPQLQSLKFDCIVYNFPHAGFSNGNASREAQIRKHQKLVRGFLRNAKKMIKDDGQVHITHKCVGFFLEWNIEMLGSSQGLRLVQESPFNLRNYPGYKTKYGYGGDANFNWRPAKTYKFQLANSSKKKRTKKKTKEMK